MAWLLVYAITHLAFPGPAGESIYRSRSQRRTLSAFILYYSSCYHGSRGNHCFLMLRVIIRIYCLFLTFLVSPLPGMHKLNPGIYLIDI
jgi:hypothetical protein